jgi:addiction module HigA family antidote
MTAKIPPVHPGEILQEEFLEPLSISQYRLSKDINVPPRRINEIVHGKRSISADTALRLGRFLEIEKDKLGKLLEKEVKIFTESAV